MMYKIVNFIAHGKVSLLGEDGSCCASLCTQSRVILVRKTAFYVLELRVDMRCECTVSIVFERLVFKTAFDHVHSKAYKLVGEHAMWTNCFWKARTFFIIIIIFIPLV